MKAYRAFFATSSLCTGLLLAAMASPSWAADQGTPPPPAPQPATTQPGPGAAPASATANAPNGTEVGELVVTGSLIKKNNFNSASPLDVITADQAELEGNVDTSQILQLAPVAANAEQINNFFTGLVGFAGGAGANTLSLRGLGSDRTLILLNGERMGPAGVGGEVGPIDLNTIPASIIDHIEILKDGASSIYGSDAVAGVVNIITKSNQEGFDLHAYGDGSASAGGNTYELNGSWGKTFDKGYINAGFDYYRQNALFTGNRDYLNCSHDLVKDATTGQSADITDPATGQDKCFGQFFQGDNITNSIEDLALPIGNVYVGNKSAVAGGGQFGLDLPGFQAVGLQICQGGVLCAPGAPISSINTAATRASMALIPFNSQIWNGQTAISPDTRYTFTLFGG
jgi:iron complex outermembrane receptor protein